VKKPPQNWWVIARGRNLYERLMILASTLLWSNCPARFKLNFEVLGNWAALGMGPPIRKNIS
jgi:hypothetical protein